MHQNAEERLELLHTITEIVHMEVDKRMDILTAQKQQTPPRGKRHPGANAPRGENCVRSFLASG